MEDKVKIKDKLVKLFSDFLDNAVGPTKNTLPLVKKFDNELMQATEVVYEPNKLDAHNEWMSKATVALLCERLKKAFFEDGNACINLFHMKPLEKSEVELLDIYIQDKDIYVGEDLVPEGTCIATVQYHNQELWEMRKAGIIGGFSVQGECVYIDPKENSNDD